MQGQSTTHARYSGGTLRFGEHGVLELLRDASYASVEREPELPITVDEHDVDVGEDGGLPSVETTMTFLPLCDQYGSHEAAVEVVAKGWRAVVSGLPGRDVWPGWNGAEMRATVKYLQQAGAAMTEFGALRR